MTDALVIGAGPAGLMAAHALAKAGRKVLVVEAKSSVGRKFLMAGKSGLNLTKDEPFSRFIDQYSDRATVLRPMLQDFDKDAVQQWARDLGQQVFTGSSGRVFPKSMKASPLLRAWLAHLAGMAVEFRTRWRWQGWQNDDLVFSTPEGTMTLKPKVTVLALGGASWRRLGSDGSWSELLHERNVGLAPFQPANSGLMVNWSGHMTRFFGVPVKGSALSAGDLRTRGEFVISRRGLEGGGIYSITRAVRDGKDLYLDLMPDLSEADVLKKISAPRGKSTLINHLRKRLKLDTAKLAMLNEFGRPLPTGKELAHLVKELPIRHAGLRPLDEAISTAGGVSFEAVDQGLMLRNVPGFFVCGEMLDWEAPTGGYLITACLATGKWAGSHAAGWHSGSSPNAT